MLCCLRKRLLGLAEACLDAAVIADKGSHHLGVGQQLGVAHQLGVGSPLGRWIVHMLGVLGYREQVAE